MLFKLLSIKTYVAINNRAFALTTILCPSNLIACLSNRYVR